MILTERDRQDLTYAMKSALLEQCKENPAYFGENLAEVVSFIKEGATYEQILNLTFNENRNEQYLPAELMECLAVTALTSELNKMFPATPVVESLAPYIDEILQENKMTDAAKKAYTYAKTSVTNAGSATAEKFRSLRKSMSDSLASVTKKYPAINKRNSWISAGIAATVGAGFIIKKYMSANAKECKGRIGSDYTECVANLKKKANAEAIKALRTAMASCAQATNPEKCKASYQKEINKRK